MKIPLLIGISPAFVEGNSIYSLADSSKKHTKMSGASPHKAESSPPYGYANSLHEQLIYG